MGPEIWWQAVYKGATEPDSVRHRAFELEGLDSRRIHKTVEFIDTDLEGQERDCRAMRRIKTVTASPYPISTGVAQN